MVSRKKQKKRDYRDIVLFLGGLAGIYHETVMYQGTGDREVLILAFMAMLGFPVLMRADEKRNGKDEETVEND